MMSFLQRPASPNYSNAHFGWALFYLRYGYIGFIYLLMFALLMAANIYRNVRSKNNFNRMVLILCIAGIIYIFTYMAFDIILSGIQFMHMRSGPRKLAASGSTSRDSSPPKRCTDRVRTAGQTNWQSRDELEKPHTKSLRVFSDWGRMKSKLLLLFSSPSVDLVPTGYSLLFAVGAQAAT